MTDNAQPSAALGVLLANAVDGVVQAQAQLDRDALGRVSLYMDTPEGGVALPPLWYTLSDVAIELELAASVTRMDTAAGPGSRLDARLLNPTAVSLFGHAAASGLKVSLRLAPREAATAVPPLPPALPAPG
ncbi:MAG: hypothetical protein IPJ08_24275 [Burkholderiales bacterium]|nr:hypothetical protein [Burkholderiales bacterium]